jgi:hypothetical protein
MIQPMTIRTATTFADPTKGSFTNKTQCAKEHIKNDMSAALALSVPTAVAVGAVVKPNLTKKAAKYVGSAFSNATNTLAKWLNKTETLKDGKIVKTLGRIGDFAAKHAKAAGIVGMVAVGAGVVANILINHAFKEGQIDQKYTDAAKIESRSKNIILEQEASLNASPIVDSNA